MFDDPMLQLAFSIYHNRGVYALLLGSGISRAAEIPTGWEVVNDLILQLATTLGEELVEDPRTWFTARFGQEPSYDDLLEALGKSPFERNAILRPYFEPTDEERAEDIKMPTAAHRAIAWLIKQKYVQVVLTTNFDRLLEQALEDIGVRPNIVVESRLEGMRPLQHSDITIIKLHGDYLDGDFKNTAQELSSYSKPMVHLLKQMLDEYGLIVCGWSGDWDVALRKAIEGAKQRRYSTYWCAYSEPSEITQGLIDHRGAEAIRNKSADDFFEDLQQKVEALEKFNRQHPLSVAVAVERTKKMIPNEDRQIELEDFVRTEIERAYKTFTSEEFIAKRTQILKGDSREQILSDLWALYLGPSEIILHTTVTLAWYGKEHHAKLLTEAVTRWMENPLEYNQRHSFGRYFPVLVLIYACGMAAVYNNNWQFIKALMVDPRVRDRHSGNPLPPVEIVGKEIKDLRIQLEGTRDGLLVEEIFYNWCRPILLSQIPVDDNYNYIFDLFDMILALLYMAYNLEEKRNWFPTFMAVTTPRSWNFIYNFWRDGGQQGDNWNLLNSGLFNKNRLKLSDVLQAYTFQAQRYQQAKFLYLFKDLAEIFNRPDTIT